MTMKVKYLNSPDIFSLQFNIVIEHTNTCTHVNAKIRFVCGGNLSYYLHDPIQQDHVFLTHFKLWSMYKLLVYLRLALLLTFGPDILTQDTMQTSSKEPVS